MLSPLFFFIHSLIFLLLPFTNATPFKRDVDSTNDIGILNFALFAERISSAMLTDGLTRFTAEDFENAGYPSFVYRRLQEMAQHEVEHINYLVAAISEVEGKPALKCDYNFSYQDPRSFVGSLVLQKSVVTAMYGGCIPFLASKPLTTLMLSILGVEARDIAWTNSAVQKDSPWNTALETPLTRQHAYTLLSQQVDNCPENNGIQLNAFPSLRFLSASAPGKRVQFDASNISNTQQLLRESHTWIAFLTGEGIQYAPVRASRKPHIFEVTIPKNLVGIIYAVLTSSNKKLSDLTTIAGPAILNFRYNSSGVPD